MNAEGTIVQTLSRDIRGVVVEDTGSTWRIEWDDGKETLSDAALLRHYGHVVEDKQP